MVFTEIGQCLLCIFTYIKLVDIGIYAYLHLYMSIYLRNHFDTNTKINTLKQSPSTCHAMLIDRFAVKLHV